MMRLLPLLYYLLLFFTLFPRKPGEPALLTLQACEE